MNTPKKAGHLNTPLGICRIEAIGNSITGVRFVDSEEPVDMPSSPVIEAAFIQLTEYFDGVRDHFSVPILPEGTYFQGTVWEEIQKIPFGTTISYELLARRLGDIKVIRAAASANGKNPLAILIPCHRVIGKNGALTGYSGGLWRKQWLLKHEQAGSSPPLF